MLLYAMDQPQHATGGAWQIICYRIVIGLIVFEIVMIGQIASLSAFVQSVAISLSFPFNLVQLLLQEALCAADEVHCPASHQA